MPYRNEQGQLQERHQPMGEKKIELKGKWTRTESDY